MVDPADPGRVERHVAVLRTLKRFRDLDGDQLRSTATDPLYHGALMVRTREADGGIAGAVHTTAAVIRAGIRCVGRAGETTTISSSFFMVVRPFRGPEPEVLTFADSAIVPDPTADQLAEIAVASCRARRRIVGDQPRVAFLSYSTKGSAEGPSVEKVRRALARFREMLPEVPADGELQADAALIEAVSRRKLPDSPVAGTANVLIFPRPGRRQYRLQACSAAGRGRRPGAGGPGARRTLVRPFPGRVGRRRGQRGLCHFSLGGLMSSARLSDTTEDAIHGC